MKVARPPPTFPAAAVASPVKAQPASPVDTSAVETKSKAVVLQYFEAFKNGDVAAMKKLYAPGATFKDNMFDLPNRDSILKMWGKAPPFESYKLEVLGVKGNEVHTRWTVDYKMFGHKVHNVVDSRIAVNADGQIASQRESWDQSKWLSQALPVIPKWGQGLAMMVMRPLVNMRTVVD